jgi:regulator of sigma E protease
VEILLCAAAIISLVIFVHELGHFAAAKLFGIRILTVSVGFGPRVWKRQLGETLYCLSAIPLGGYVRPYAAACDAQSPARDGKRRRLFGFLLPLGAEELKVLHRLGASDPGNLLRKSLAARACFILGGTFFNCLLAIVALTLWLSVPARQLRVPELRVASLMKSSPAGQAGLERADLIQAINGVPVHDWKSYETRMEESRGSEVNLLVERKIDGETRQIAIRFIPRKILLHRHGQPATSYMAGFHPLTAEGHIPFFKALGASIRILAEAVGDFIFAGVTEAKDKATESPIGFLEGVLDIGVESSGSVGEFVSTLVSLSFVLGLLNLLPVPALDGGALATLLLQKLFHVPISVALEQKFTYCGLLLLVVLIVLQLSADLIRSMELMLS